MDWLARKEAERQKRLVQLERILLAIGVHGPNVVHERGNAEIIRWMRDHWNDAYRQVRAKEREEYWRRQAEAQAPLEHESGCACWRCVLRLNARVARHQAELKVKAGYEPEGDDR
jgi:hypothetical protein